jgi:drug/metabolite transporter (DMT)-like permease
VGWLALLALLCFAANSVLARVALRAGQIDAASFTAIRLAAGALFLSLLLRRAPPLSARTALGALLLFLYAAPFSFAYLGLSAGTGALLLFGAVQATMIGSGIVSGERPAAREWAGLAIALGGLFLLNLPGLSAPPLLPAGLMIAAGIAWGFYSLRGRGATAPLAETAASFVLATPLGLLLLVVGLPEQGPTGSGVLAAVASGALASGGGYAAWYAVLPRLSATRAGTIQLAVPVVTALAGVALLGEQLTLRLFGSAVLILGGVGLALSARARARNRNVSIR